tara:strand:+ start:393 stop:869 length:477 start_codon:yes stop_codon:yes gene_type:complete
MNVIDNFLPEEEFKHIQSLMMGDNINWFYHEGRTYPDDGLFLMFHMFYDPNHGKNSRYIDIWNTFMNKVEAKKCTRIKANLTFKTPTIEPAPFHTDYKDMKTATFYINTNNGYTEFKNGAKVSSVANRVCIFDSNLEHRGTTHSEGGNQRIVINFNYN